MRLLARFETALREEARADDPAQAAVAGRLDALDRCLDATPAPARWRQALLSLRGREGYPPACRGIYLWGGVGRGKTWLMDLFVAGRPARECRRLHFQHLMREVHARRNALARTERPLERVAAQMARAARVWCIDEFMVQDIGDAMILHGLLQGLLDRGVVLVLTSNTPPARLYEGGLQRERFLPAIALLQRLLDVVEIGAGDDFRMRQLAQAQTYLDGNDPATPARMRALFERLAGVAADAGGSMRIEDRPIATIAHAGGLAWFGFDALCEGPRAATDYIALARRLHTVFLSGVPLFDGGNDDAARRFVALIDELYDQRVHLVIAAAAEPAALYRGERLRGLFERTASRLIEMRKAGWIGYRSAPDGPPSADSREPAG